MNKIIGHNLLNTSKGNITLLSVPMIFNENSCFVKFQKNSENTDYKDIIYYIGKIQGQNGTSLLIEKYGFEKDNDKETALNIFFDQASVVGVATEVFFEKKDNSLFFSFLNVGFAKEYYTIYGKQKEGVDHYLRGLVTGVAQTLYGNNKILYGVERECISQGREKCVFEIKNVEDWNIEFPEINKIVKKFKKYNNIIEKQNVSNLIK